nr:hypothetical transcript [Hymenolepis microstoma]
MFEELKKNLCAVSYDFTIVSSTKFRDSPSVSSEKKVILIQLAASPEDMIGAILLTIEDAHDNKGLTPEESYGKSPEIMIDSNQNYK